MRRALAAFSAAYGLARFCGRGRLVAWVYGVRAVRVARRSPDGLDAQGRKRVGL